MFIEDKSLEQQPVCTEIQSLYQLLTIPSTWTLTSSQQPTEICLCKISTQAISNEATGSRQPPIISHCLTIHADLTWTLYVHNHEVNHHNCSSLQSTPRTLDSESLMKFLQLLDRLYVCCGQPDSHFVSMINAKKGKIISHDGKITASIDQHAPVSFNGQNFLVTVRTESCEIITNSKNCSSCKLYRNTLHAMYNWWCKRQTNQVCTSDTTSHSNEHYLNTPEKKAKMSKLKERDHVAEKQVQKLRATIRDLTQKQGESVDNDLHADLIGIMNENYEQVKKAFPEASFARLFWEQQLQAVPLKIPGKFAGTH